jgi:hypothetical protein
MPTHSHPVILASWNTNSGGSSGSSGPLYNGTTGTNTNNSGSSHGHNHSFTGTAIDLTVRYVNVMLATKS